MTHLSDLSYLQRTISTAWFYGWFVVYVFRWDRFEALRLRRLLRFELRSVVTVLVLISLALQLAYDIGSARLKYLEGFWVNPRTHEIQSKPAQAWSEPDMLHVEPLYYTLACCLAFENSVFFLLQAFWSYISKSVTKSSFMTSFEFKINIGVSCFVVVLFPTIQYLFRNDFVYREVVPQMIFSTLTFITGVLGIRTHFRLVALIKNACEISNETTMNVLQKLEYFKDMNVILTFSFFGCSIPLGITSADGLLAHPIIATNKFASDFLITNLNFFEFIIWVTLTLIFYPRKTGTGSPFGGSSNMASYAVQHNNNNYQSNRGSKDAHLPRFNEVKPQDDDYYRKPLNPMDYDLNNDPVWNNEVITITQNKCNSSHPYKHHRTLSNENRWGASQIPLVSSMIAASSTAAAPVVPTRPTSSKKSQSGMNSGNTGSQKNNGSDKPEIISNTIYYHEGLAKAQQQQQDQANDHYSRGLQNGSISDVRATAVTVPSPTLDRSFSQNGHYNVQIQDHLPQRSSSHNPLVTKSSKNPSRHGANSSVDIRPSRDYPSLIHETANWSSNSADNIQRSFSAGSSRHYQHCPAYNNTDEVLNSTRAASALTQRTTSQESDRNMIQIAYVRPVAGHNESYDNGGHINSFYDGVGQEGEEL
ncbi:hypothetical protein EDD11_001594 [Mortierella claussenii]|nr:hypothetical protein EDD11_001594 [Mortierella claussenii]